MIQHCAFHVAVASMLCKQIGEAKVEYFALRGFAKSEQPGI
jgi:hypothetical protein